jgi:hypothetical protein
MASTRAASSRTIEQINRQAIGEQFLKESAIPSQILALRLVDKVDNHVIMVPEAKYRSTAVVKVR